MAITYDNKAFLNENPSIPDVNKITDDDMNEIKSVVNTNETNLSTLQTNFTNATTYSTTEKVIGTYDGKPLYRKLYKVTTITTGSYQTIALDSTYRVKKYEGYLHRTNGRVDSFVGNGNYDYLPLLATIRTTGIEYYVGSAYGTGAESVDFIIEYTKTTD